jgi:hypothetical protein
MASGETLETMRAYEAIMWPAIEHAERHYRRTDRLWIATYIGGILMLTGMSALTPKGPLQGVVIGLSVTFAFAGGIVYKGILLRRSQFKTLRSLHEQAELTLLYHSDDDEP